MATKKEEEELTDEQADRLARILQERIDELDKANKERKGK